MDDNNKVNSEERKEPGSTVTTQRRTRANTIDLVDLCYMLLGHWWQILLCVLLGCVIAFMVTKFYITPLYTSSSKLYVVSASSNSVVNLSDLQLSSSLAQDYQELIMSRPVLESVVEELDLDMSTTALGNMIDITNPDDTRILVITVTSDDPQQATDIANELAKQAIIYLPEVMETTAPHLAESAIVPTGKSSPSYSYNIMCGFILGLVISCGFLVIRYVMNDTFTTPDDVVKYLGVQPLASIPEEHEDKHSSSKHSKRRR